jgi:hypothetical protein
MLTPFELTCNKWGHDRYAGFSDFSAFSNCKSDDTGDFTHVDLRDAVTAVALGSYIRIITNLKSKICICILYPT